MIDYLNSDNKKQIWKKKEFYFESYDISNF